MIDIESTLKMENKLKSKSKINDMFNNHFISEEVKFLQDLSEVINKIDEDFKEATVELYNESNFEDGDEFITSQVYNLFDTADELLDEGIKEKVQNAKYKYKKKEKAIDRGVADFINKQLDGIKDDVRDKHVKQMPIKLSKIIKSAVAVGAAWAINPAIGAVTAIAGFALSKKIDAREKDRLISEIKEELLIVEEKIKDADSNGDKKQKYQLIRLKNSLERSIKRIQYGRRF